MFVIVKHKNIVSKHNSLANAIERLHDIDTTPIDKPNIFYKRKPNKLIVYFNKEHKEVQPGYLFNTTITVSKPVKLYSIEIIRYSKPRVYNAPRVLKPVNKNIIEFNKHIKNIAGFSPQDTNLIPSTIIDKEPLEFVKDIKHTTYNNPTDVRHLIALEAVKKFNAMKIAIN